MPPDQLPITRKRCRPQDWYSSQTPDSSINTYKRHKHINCVRSPSPSTFWNNLSKIHLTRTALEELNRRNKANWDLEHNHRFLVSETADWDEANARVVLTAEQYVQHCGSSTLDRLRYFARRGGPDMSDVQAVSMPNTAE